MSSEDRATLATQGEAATTFHGQEQVPSSVKGKEVAVDAMDEDDDEDDDEESDDEDEIPEAAEDDLEEIDTNNIIASGRRTRGKQIDFTKAAEEYPEEEEDEEDEDYKADGMEED